MTDQVVIDSQPVRRGDEKQHYKNVKNFAEQRYRAARRNNWFLGACVLLSLGANLALSMDEARHEPTRVQPVFFGVMEDGSIDAALTYRDMSESERQEVLKEMAWKYVRACEEYSYADAQRNYDLCRKMSDDPVREAFEAKWFLPNGKDAPESPQKLWGQNGQIELERNAKPVFVRDHVIDVRYKKIIWHYNESHPPPGVCKAPTCTTWTSTIDFSLLDKMPRGPVEGDAIKFFVIRYQVGEGAI